MFNFNVHYEPFFPESDNVAPKTVEQVKRRGFDPEAANYIGKTLKLPMALTENYTAQHVTKTRNIVHSIQVHTRKQAKINRGKAGQDRIYVGPVNNYPATNASESLQAAVRSIQAYNGQEFISGSTLCSLIAGPHGITTTSVGDSEAFLIILDQNDSFKMLLPLTIENDSDNIMPLQGEPPYEWHSLNLSHSIGDRAHEAAGLSHEPTIIEYSFQSLYEKYSITDTDHLFVMVASDGLKNCIIYPEDGSLDDMCESELLARYASQEAEMLKASMDQTGESFIHMFPDRIIKLLANVNSLRDDLSIATMHLPHNIQETLQISVFDGHGNVGAEVATALCHNWPIILNGQFSTSKLPTHAQPQTSSSSSSNPTTRPLTTAFNEITDSPPQGTARVKDETDPASEVAQNTNKQNKTN